MVQTARIKVREGDVESTVDIELGCSVDGHWGQYGSSRVLRLADGLLGTDFFKQAVDGGAVVGMMTDELESSEVVIELGDEATNALNAATDGAVWGWHDGEYFLQSESWWEDES